LIVAVANPNVKYVYVRCPLSLFARSRAVTRNKKNRKAKTPFFSYNRTLTESNNEGGIARGGCDMK